MEANLSQGHGLELRQHVVLRQDLHQHSVRRNDTGGDSRTRPATSFVFAASSTDADAPML